MLPGESEILLEPVLLPGDVPTGPPEPTNGSAMFWLRKAEHQREGVQIRLYEHLCPSMAQLQRLVRE